MKKKLVVILCFCLALMVTGCNSQPSAPKEENSLNGSTSINSKISSQPIGFEPEEPETGEDAPGTPKVQPSSISLSQETPDGFLLWELRIEDEEELTLVESLLSTEHLAPSSEEEAMWPDGGSSIDFEICYEDTVITGACDPQYNGGIHDKGYTRMRTHEDGIFYHYPREIGDQLLEFLESKGIEVSY